MSKIKIGFMADLNEINRIVKKDLGKLEIDILENKRIKEKPYNIKGVINDWDGIVTDKTHLLRDENIDKIL